MADSLIPRIACDFNTDCGLKWGFAVQWRGRVWAFRVRNPFARVIPDEAWARGVRPLRVRLFGQAVRVG